MARVPTTSDYLGHLHRESRRFLDAVLAAPPRAPVPSCPAWTGDDLLWHLAEVQWFWGQVVRRRASDPAEVEAAKPARPDSRAGLVGMYRAASAALLAAVANARPADAVWTWSDDHTVGFVLRRQAHEALMHRVDAELAAGERTGMDPNLSADGVDEVLSVMHGGVPDRAEFTTHTRLPVRVVTTDTGNSWLVTPGRLAGVDPESGRAWDTWALRNEPTDDVDPAAPVAAVVSGAAGDMDCFLWNRPALGPVARTGDTEALDALNAVLTG